MNTKKIIIALALTLSIPAFAQTASTTPAAHMTKAQTARISQMQLKADKELDRRVAVLTSLISKIADMKKLTADQKTSISAAVNTQITALGDLKTKIDADTDSATLQSDVKSVTDSYRIFALVVPQIEVVATVDKFSSTIDTMTILGTKLQAQISALASSTPNSTVAQAAMTDFNAKVTDAAAQAQAALNAVVPLVPDQGDKTQMQANTQALKDARAKIQAGQKDLQGARLDATKIVVSLKK